MDGPQTTPASGGSRASRILSVGDLQQLARIYHLICVQFHLAEGGATTPPNSGPADLRKWLEKLDAGITVRQLREFVQKSREVTSESIEALAFYFIEKHRKSADDKDKIGMLLTEYICTRDPMLLREAKRITRERIAKELEPIVGRTRSADPPPAIQGLLAEVAGFRDLKALMSHSVLEQGRRWKHIPSLSYTAGGTLVAVTLYNLIVRSAFYRLLHAELHRIHRLLDQLRAHGIQHVDATGAGLAVDESLATIRELCIAWTQPLRSSYAEGQAFAQVVQVADSLQQAVDRTGPAPEAAPWEPVPAAADPEDAPLTASQPERWVAQAVVELENLQPKVRIGDADIHLSLVEAEVLFSTNPLYKKVLTQLVVLRALVQHALESPDYPAVPECYEFVVKETTRLTSIVDDIHDVVGTVPAGRLAGALDRLFDALVNLKEKMHRP